MSRRLIHIVFLFAFLLLWTACSSGGDREEQPHRITLLPVYLSIPAEDGMTTRALGDPGTYESFEIPRYLYLYIIAYKNAANGGDAILLRFEDGTNVQQLDEELWEKTVNVQNGYPTPGDSVYRYTGTVTFEIDDDVLDRSRGAKAYAVMSAVPLHGDLHGLQETFSASGDLEEAVRNLTFKAEYDKDGKLFDDGYTYLRDIYSTPYNMNTDGKDTETNGGTYYGTLQNFSSNVPSVNLTLYHIAAKMDVTWNVAVAQQPNLRVGMVKFEKLYNMGYGQSYLFKPTKNYTSSSFTNLPSGYEVVLCDGDVGMQYYGRGYTYAIPCRRQSDGKYFVPMRIRKAGAARAYAPVFTVMPTSEVFVPWIRLNLTLNNIPSDSEIPEEVAM